MVTSARTRIPTRDRGATGRGGAAALVAALALVWSAAAQPHPAAAAATCASPPGAVVNAWVGAANDGLWTTGSNWSLGRAPNVNDATSGYVCLDAGRKVRMDAGVSANLIGIDIAPATTLELRTGSMLYVHGDQTATASYVRQGATVQLSGTLGGEGRIELDGRLFWTSQPTGASSISTRRCAVTGLAPCDTTRTSVRGLLKVNDSGALNINGRGVNLFDEYLIRVRGAVKLTNTAYVAADHGTGIELLPRLSSPTAVGTFTLANDGGWYEGRPWFGLGLTTFSNDGRIVKSAGTGTSVIDAVYSQGSGTRVTVRTGRVSLPSTWTSAASTSASASVGFGSCVSSAYGCLPTTTSTETQNGQVTVPAGDSTGANVAINLDGAGPAGTIGQRVHATSAGMSATAADPAVLQLRYDAAILGGKTVSTLVIKRQPESGGAFQTVPACTSSGTPPWGVACVDRRGIAGVSSRMEGGDAVMVVRTTGFSRWVAL